MFRLTRTGRRSAALVSQITALEATRDTLIDRNRMLEDQAYAAKIDLDRVKKNREIELDEIAHIGKMRDEASELDFKSRTMDIQRECDEKVADVKDEYRDKMEKQLGTERDNIKEMYVEVLGRLPKVSVRQLDANTKHTENDG